MTSLDKAKNLTTQPHWIRTAFILAGLLLLSRVIPQTAIDPWNLINPSKIVIIIFALTLIQAIGSASILLLGHRVGSVLGGFLGGLISSTATTASLARRSALPGHHSAIEYLIFLSATLAMLLEAFFIAVFGSDRASLFDLIVFTGPILTLIALIFLHSNHVHHKALQEPTPDIAIFPILKLTALIVAALSLSKIAQHFAGDGGLMLLTFLVSLFEVHGSVIANTQLHNAEVIEASLFGSLLALSISASFFSKLFLVLTLGGSSLKKLILRSTLLLLVSLGISWLAFILIA